MLDRTQCRQSIVIRATNILGDVLKIGDSYQFVNVASTKLLGSNRKNVELKIILIERAPQEHFSKGIPDQLFMGEMQFWKELDFGVESANRSPTLLASITLSGETFFDICQHMCSGSHISQLEVSMNELEWDWDPQGTTIIWDQNSNGGYSNKPISSLNIVFTNFEAKKSSPALNSIQGDFPKKWVGENYRQARCLFLIILVILFFILLFNGVPMKFHSS